MHDSMRRDPSGKMDEYYLETELDAAQEEKFLTVSLAPEKYLLRKDEIARQEFIEQAHKVD